MRAAVDEIVAATDPDQVVLFGSFARDSPGPDSDIDLLVIGDPARHADGKRTCASSGDQLDVFVTDRQTAERYRYSAAYLEGIALGEGRTVYARNPERALAAGRAMVRRTLYDPDKAQEWNGRRDLFRMTVRPDSDGDVTITLPAGRDCTVSGAICTKGAGDRRDGAGRRRADRLDVGHLRRRRAS